MRLIHRLDPGTLLPPADVELRLAGMALEHPLYARILERLVALPKRYSELRPLLQGKNDNLLSLALKRLQAEGLINQLVDARLARGDATLYGLTKLGVDVLFNIKITSAAQQLAHAHATA
jgi:DNA-binding HxlR family transcriptional regulator